MPSNTKSIKLIGSGGFGCVYRPAIKCKNGENTKNTVSKLMLQNEALDEYYKNELIKGELKNIKKYHQYFIFVAILCDSKKLEVIQEKDVLSCGKHEVVNEFKRTKFDQLSVLNIPYGGHSLDKYIMNIHQNTKEKQNFFVYDMTISLKNLCEFGIKEMHNKNVYHADMKALNILWNDDNMIRIIDWGLARVGIPTFFINHYNGFHFNHPYESLLFNFQDKLPENKYKTLISKLVKEYKNIKILKYKEDIIIFLALKYNATDTNVIKNLEKYLLTIANLCTFDKCFSLDYFITHFYIKQDYWGIALCYVDLIRYEYKFSSNTKKKVNNLFEYMISTIEIEPDVFINLLSQIYEKN
jgi:serine/threonine protein kinase